MTSRYVLLAAAAALASLSVAACHTPADNSANNANNAVEPAGSTNNPH